MKIRKFNQVNEEVTYNQIEALTLEVIKYIFSNCTNLDFSNNGLTIIHYVCGFSTPQIVNYIIDISEEKNLDLDKLSDSGTRPFTRLLENFNCKDFHIQKKFLENMKNITYRQIQD